MNARRVLIDMALRRQRPGAGSLHASLEAPVEVPAWWRAAGRVLTGVPYLVMGGVAANAYMPPRVTGDLDVAVLPRDLPAAERALEAAGWRSRGAWRAPTGGELDLMPCATPGQRRRWRSPGWSLGPA